MNLNLTRDELWIVGGCVLKQIGKYKEIDKYLIRILDKIDELDPRD